MNMEILLKYWNGINSLFLEMAPFLMLGFLISGLLYIIISKEFISNNLGKPGLLSIKLKEPIPKEKRYRHLSLYF